MIRLQVWLDRAHAGWLTHAPETNRFSFAYTPAWAAASHRFALSPQLPVEPDPAQTAETHSANVRQFFENLLPEGEALDHAAQAAGTARSNLVGLIVALGRETSGAVRVLAEAGPTAPPVEDDSQRRVTAADLSARIRQRAEVPFSVWDGKVRLSIAGYQDKIAVYEHAGKWSLVEGSRLASTVIIKPVPVNPAMATLPANEFVCMQLAQRAGLAVANTRLVHVPEPVLLVDRFDRQKLRGRVQRLHVIDGCQALGLAVGMKYERAYGDGRDVRHLRDGVSLPKLFGLLAQSPQPAADRQALLRWAIFQVLIGNTDAHGKNVAFFCDVQGLRLAPAYDMVCTAALKAAHLSDTYAMAIGDAFQEADVTAYEWAHMAVQCGLPIPMVAAAIEQTATRTLGALDGLDAHVAAHGVGPQVVGAIAKIVAATCKRQLKLVPRVRKLRAADFH